MLALGHGVLVGNDRRRIRDPGLRNAPPPGGKEADIDRSLPTLRLDRLAIAHKRLRCTKV